jgi:methyl-accepting chemotaxis protein
MEQQDSKKTGFRFSLKARTVVPTAIIMLVIIVTLTTMSTRYFSSAYDEIIRYAQYDFDANIKIAVDTLISSLAEIHRQYSDGLIPEELAKEIAKALVRNTRYSSAPGMVDDGYFWADMADGLCIAHYNQAVEGTMRLNAQDMEGNFFIQNFIRLGNAGGGYSEFYFGRPGDEGGSHKKRGYTQKFEPFGWFISTGNYYDDMELTIGRVEAQKRQALTMLLGVSLAVAVIGILLLLKIITGVVKLIVIVSDQIRRLSLGDTVDSSIAIPKRDDEIGDLLNNIGKLSEAINVQADVMQLIAEGDYSVTLDARSDRDVLNKAISSMIDTTNNTLYQINATAQQVSTNAGQVAETAANISDSSEQMAIVAQTIAEGATKQDESMERVSSSIAEISEKTKINAATADQAAQLTLKIINNAKKGSRQMEEMLSSVHDINEASKSVSKIMETINGIAGQTNLLALNAAIEAARAGEQGRGFAVVAEEVRKLAVQSGEAVKETSVIIQSSMEKAELGTRVANEMAASLTEIVAGINESNQFITEMA